MVSIISNSELDNKMFEVINDSNLYSNKIRLAAKMQYLTGCRANDILEFSRWSILMSGQLQLVPQKGNNNRLFDYSDVDDDFYFSVASSDNIIGNLDYRKYNYYVERAMHKYDFHVLSKNISTHLFRHNYAKKLHDSGMSDIDIQNKLGERRLSSAQGYINSVITWFP